MAEKYAAKNVTAPMNAIWCHAVINGDKEAATKLWTEHIQFIKDVYFRPITERAFKDNNAAMLYELIDYMESSDTTNTNLGGVNACLLSIHLNNGQFDDALKIAETLKSSKKPIYHKDLKRLQIGLEAAGKEFPFDIKIDWMSTKNR